MATTHIACRELFIDDLAPRLDLPHQLHSIDGLNDDAMRELMERCTVLVSTNFKGEWIKPARSAPLLIQVPGAGCDGIEMTGMPTDSVLCNVYGHERAVCETAVMLMLMLHKQIMLHDRNLRRGDWTRENPYLPELIGHKLLIIGFGHIGAELARWGSFLGMEVSAVTRHPQPDRASGTPLRELAGYCDLPRLLPEADYVVVAIPAAEGSTGLVGESELALMKPTAGLVNVGRGPVVDEKALYEALASGRIKGAGLDVWYCYPEQVGDLRLPGNYPFHELDNVILSPHKPSGETMVFRFGFMADNIKRFATGGEVQNVVRRMPPAAPG